MEGNDENDDLEKPVGRQATIKSLFRKD